MLRDLECEYCTKEITFNEYCNNNAMCDSCYMFHCQKTPVVRGCDNYLTCGQEANVGMGNGLLCDSCRSKLEPKKETKKNFTKFINGLKRAVSVE